MRVVLALGGNALGNSPREQLDLLAKASKNIVDLVEGGHQVVAAHGNGPQVGMIIKAFESLNELDKNSPEMPFAESIAMSQGYIGYHLQNKLREELLARGIEKNPVSIVTQVKVDPRDEAFSNPTKPIGSFYSEEDARELMKNSQAIYKEDSGRGYRRVVASPKPVEIVEAEIIKDLVGMGNLVIAVGGGGIPVEENSNKLLGLDAVIDKDWASSKLADQLDADMLIVLTAVDQVAINFGKENEKWLSELDIDTLNQYIEEGHFAPGSMLPKIEAARDFVLAKEGRTALITSLEKAAEGIKGETGTIIKR